MKRLGLILSGAGLVVLLAAAAADGPAPADPNLELARKAYACRMAGDIDQAVDMLREALRAHPRSGVLNYELARACLQRLDFEAMQQAAERAAAALPLDAGHIHFAAMASIYSLIDAAHNDDDARMQAMGRRALAELETALAVDPDCHQARYLLLQQMGDMAPELGLAVADRDEQWDHVAYLETHDPVLGAKARCLFLDPAEQRGVWEQVLRERPDDCRALSEAAEALIDLGELDAARDCLDRARARDPHQCYGMLRLSLAHLMDGDYNRALDVTRRYIDSDPPVALKAFALGRLAQIHRRMGDAERCNQLLEQARALDPHVWITVMPPPKEAFLPL